VKTLQSLYPTHPLVLAAIGHCHVAGRGVSADKALAEIFYKQVDVASLESLANNKVLNTSEELNSDYPNKQEQQQQVTFIGSAHAQFHLGYMLQWGKGTCVKDVQKAVEWCVQ
jgi:TPR repeat protein